MPLAAENLLMSETSLMSERTVPLVIGTAGNDRVTKILR